jgi:rhamnose utilization protein RhaD (predicted bifunctional aldolase and dehydrogenase)
MAIDAMQELVRLSARLGADPLLIQGAGGNTSIKTGNALWVKASGKWLAAAEREPIFVAVSLSGVRRRVEADEADPVSCEAIADVGGAGLRPSIETTLHALMPHTVVVHVHSVNAMAWAVRADGAQKLAERLHGLRWAWVPYARPGLPLTRAVAEILRARAADILILANHGLVVGGSDCGQADALLAEVEERIRLPVRSAPAPDLAMLSSLADGTGYRLPKYPEVHGIATEPVNRRIAVGGSLYPDHVVFLGPGVTELPAHSGVAEFLKRAAAFGRPAMLLAGSAGVLARDDLSEGGEEMLRCLAMVVARVPDGSEVIYLSPAQDAELLNWDAEVYRQSLAQR